MMYLLKNWSHDETSLVYIDKFSTQNSQSSRGRAGMMTGEYVELDPPFGGSTSIR